MFLYYSQENVQVRWAHLPKWNVPDWSRNHIAESLCMLFVPSATPRERPVIPSQCLEPSSLNFFLLMWWFLHILVCCVTPQTRMKSFGSRQSKHFSKKIVVSKHEDADFLAIPCHVSKFINLSWIFTEYSLYIFSVVFPFEQGAENSVVFLNLGCWCLLPEGPFLNCLDHGQPPPSPKFHLWVSHSTPAVQSQNTYPRDQWQM